MVIEQVSQRIDPEVHSRRIWGPQGPVYHRKLSADPTSQYSTEVKQCVDSMFKRGLIEKKAKNFLVPKRPRAARFYLLPKIHKPANPGRPIVASNGARTENISRFTDHFFMDERAPTTIIYTGHYWFYTQIKGVTSIASGLSASNSRCLLALYQYSTRGRHHSLRGVPKLSRVAGTSHGRPLWADPVSVDEELVRF